MRVTSEDGETPDDEREPLCMVEGPPVTKLAQSWVRSASVGAWVALGLLLLDLMDYAPWPHLKGRIPRFVGLFAWTSLSTMAFQHWRCRLERRQGDALLYRDRIVTSKLQTRRLRWSRVRGYTHHGDHLRIHRQRPEGASLFDDLTELFFPDAQFTIPLSQRSDEERVLATLAELGVIQLDD